MISEDTEVVNNVENVRVFMRIRPETENQDQTAITSDKNIITLTKSSTAKTFKFCKIFDHTSSQIDLYRSIAVPIVAKVVTVTYLEIYNEEIRDLLSETPKKKLTVHEKPGLGVYVKDLLGFTVDSLEGVTEMLCKGNKNRATGSTKLNDTSSRSHAIFTILVESKNKTNNKTTFGKLNLVDLAGSERVNRTLATGDRLKEAGKINLSLSVLGNVISALVDGKPTHIPYRNSNFTRLLQDSLGGNSLLVLEEQKETKRKRKKSKTLINNEEFEKIEMEKGVLENKIFVIQKKILVGGENLFEKAQQQMELIEDTAKELEHLDSTHQLLQDILPFKAQEKSFVEEHQVSLQEEEGTG
ncbi:hypothetical protein NQ315_011470 [Exocentrus adspersus]|uniref:Kinesin-like protein n=1 Tax=Exocentrus adspersus TaxID=1586481 RepID=A0AAV8VUH6_9CUCU|nr:hypothetical protein NQ315_011470 [Exocentrus adspersus]